MFWLLNVEACCRLLHIWLSNWPTSPSESGIWCTSHFVCWWKPDSGYYSKREGPAIRRPSLDSREETVYWRSNSETQRRVRISQYMIWILEVHSLCGTLVKYPWRRSLPNQAFYINVRNLRNYIVQFFFWEYRVHGINPNMHQVPVKFRSLTRSGYCRRITWSVQPIVCAGI